MNGVDYLIREHRIIESLFTTYESTIDPPVKRRLVNEMIRLLSIHTVIEEENLYPLVKEVILVNGQGEKLSEHGLKEHHETKVTLEKLLSLDETSVDFEITVNHLIKKTKHHHGDEEGDIFPLLRMYASEEQLLQFGVNLEKSKQSAPTHPHPNAPDQPPMNKIVAPFLHVADKIMDQTRLFPEDGPEVSIRDTGAGKH